MDRRRLLALAALAIAPGLIAAAPEKKTEKDAPPPSSANFVEIDTLAATIMRSNGRRGVLTVASGLDIPDQKLRAKACSVTPRLRAAFLQSLQNYASRMSPGTAPNAEVVIQLLQREADRVLGQKGARLLLGAMLVT